MKTQKWNAGKSQIIKMESKQLPKFTHTHLYSRLAVLTWEETKTRDVKKKKYEVIHE